LLDAGGEPTNARRPEVRGQPEGPPELLLGVGEVAVAAVRGGRRTAGVHGRYPAAPAPPAAEAAGGGGGDPPRQPQERRCGGRAAAARTAVTAATWAALGVGNRGRATARPANARLCPTSLARYRTRAVKSGMQG